MVNAVVNAYVVGLCSAVQSVFISLAFYQGGSVQDRRDISRM